MNIKLVHLLKNGERAPVLSWFLTPEEQKLLRSKTENILFSENYPGEERRRAIIHPPGFEIEPDFKIIILEITSPAPLRHADILGAALATGITREVLGDIITGDKSCLIAAAEIWKYLIDNLTRIGKYNVQIRQIERLEAAPTDNYRSASIIVPGLRLDAVLSKSLALSRGRSQELIRAGAVKVNGEVKLSQHYLCKEADLLSVRRFGRILIGEITGKTKKNNLILNIKKTI